MTSENRHHGFARASAPKVTVTPECDHRLRVEELRSHESVANAVDRVLEVWSNVGLATMMAEIRGTESTEIVRLLDELAAAGVRAKNALLETSGLVG
jgi:hypothetical protein